jgi:hypothetical protein
MKFVFGLTTCLALAVGFEAKAVVVHFGDYASGPSDTLQFGGVTVSDWTGWDGTQAPAGEPVTVPGAGLGADLIGPSYTIDRELHFQVGTPFATEIDEDLNISVNGTINSLTIVPYMSILEPSSTVTFPFDIHFQTTGGEPPIWMVVDPSDPSPVEITFQGQGPSELRFIGLGHDSFPGTDGYLYNYFEASGYSSMTVRMGFTITELDYTPVPEPSSALFLGLGLARLWTVTRRRKHRF